jgi:ABC-type cobalamin transport system permease subunit
MSDTRVDTEHAFTHTLTVFSVSAGMIGVCLTAIGLVKIVAHAKGFETVCDDLIAIDAIVFGVATLLGFQGLRRFARHQAQLSHQLMDGMFLVGLALTIVTCAVLTWSMF